jgi:hypothetical protein
MRVVSLDAIHKVSSGTLCCFVSCHKAAINIRMEVVADVALIDDFNLEHMWSSKNPIHPHL